MQLEPLLDQLFPDGHAVRQDGAFARGSGRLAGVEVAVVATLGATPIGVEIALLLAGEILRVVREHPGRPILLLVDNSGQRLSRRDELLGINAYLAHLAKSIELARRHGHRSVSLVYGQAVSGGYLACGMLADSCCALADAEIRVMGLPAMARVTKIPQARLEQLSRNSPVFAPGAANYVAMGALEPLWAGDLSGQLRAALSAPASGDQRRVLGEQRGGRRQARQVAQRVRSDGPE